jgi:hypothetical protein
LASDRTQVERFEDFARVIVSGDSSTAARLLDVSPLWAKERAIRGATRQAFKQYFFDRIQHYINRAILPCILQPRRINSALSRS